MLSACFWVRYGSQAEAAASADVRPLEEDVKDDDESGDMHITGLSDVADSDDSDEKDSESEGDSAADDDSDK